MNHFILGFAYHFFIYCIFYLFFIVITLPCYGFLRFVPVFGDLRAYYEARLAISSQTRLASYDEFKVRVLHEQLAKAYITKAILISPLVGYFE